MKIRWISGSHATQFGVFHAGQEVETKDYGIPADVVKIWINDGVIEEVKETKEKKKERLAKEKQGE